MPVLSPNLIFAGRYTLLEKLGIGGYSEVWKALDNMAGEMLVALKIFAPDKGLDQNGIQVFSKEYGLVFNLNHQNLLKPSHYDIWEGSPYLVMPYCKNGSLYGKLGDMSETEVLRFIQQAASALNYLHSLPTPIIHQDIKPDNFLIHDNGNYLLSDFGISSRLRRTLTRSIGSATSTGTLAYMPPERFGSEQKFDPAGDIFSLGVTIFELLTERQPFGDHGGLLLKNGADIPNLPQNFSSHLNNLVCSCLNSDPTLRPIAKNLETRANELSTSLKDGLAEPSKPNPISEVHKTVQIPIAKLSSENEKYDEYHRKTPHWYILLFIFLYALLTIFIIGVLIQKCSDKLYVSEAGQDSSSSKEKEYQIKPSDKTENISGAGIDSVPENNTIVYTVVDEMPQFPGGETERNKFLSNNLVYPQQATEAGIQGTVYVSFVINSKGNVTNVKILRGIGGGCDEEAVRVVKLMPRWQPGKQDGKLVRVLFNMPIYFKL